MEENLLVHSAVNFRMKNASSSGQAARARSKGAKIHVKTQIGATQSSLLFFLENTKQQLFLILEASMSSLSYI
jgi:hypothetical protein